MAKAKKAAKKRTLVALLAIGHNDNGDVVVGVSTPQTCGTVSRQQAIDDAKNSDDGYNDFKLDRVVEVEGALTVEVEEADVPVEVVKL